MIGSKTYSLDPHIKNLLRKESEAEKDGAKKDQIFTINLSPPTTSSLFSSKKRTSFRGKPSKTLNNNRKLQVGESKNGKRLGADPIH